MRGWLSMGLLFLSVAPVAAQFDEVPVPDAMQKLEFMVGEWTVTGAFRTPDSVTPDRAVWYLTENNGVVRFDGSSWTSFRRGDSALADSVLNSIRDRATPFAFQNVRSVSWIQDGFMLLIDGGRTAGSTLLYFDVVRSKWVSTQFHAPTNGVTRAEAELSGGPPMFEGTGTDRRGERMFRSRYEVHGPSHYTIHTDVSFDGGSTWIDDQMVQDVRRR